MQQVHYVTLTRALCNNCIMQHVYYAICILCKLHIMQYVNYATCILCNMYIMQRTHYATRTVSKTFLMQQIHYKTGTLCNTCIRGCSYITSYYFEPFWTPSPPYHQKSYFGLPPYPPLDDVINKYDHIR